MEQSELLRQVIRCFESLKVPYLITGAIASIAYGEPRLTIDIDILADIKDEHIKALKKWNIIGKGGQKNISVISQEF